MIIWENAFVLMLSENINFKIVSAVLKEQKKDYATPLEMAVFTPLSC